MNNDDKILFIDLETTGVDHTKHMITQIAAEYHINGNKLDEFFINVKAVPDQITAISLEALKITKQSLKQTLTEGTPEPEAIMNFVDWLLGLDTDRMYICGHNVHFDVGFIKAVLQKYRLEQWDSIASYRIEDTCSLSRTLRKCGVLPPGNSSLGNLASDLKIAPSKGEHLHNAATDVKVTAKIYYKLVKLLRNLAELNHG